MDSDLAVTHAYGFLEVEMREQPADKRRLIHFVNFTGQMQRPIDRIIPCHDIEVFIRMTEPVLSVHLLQADVPADFTISAEAIIFRRRKEITCSFSKKNGESGLCFLKSIEQVIS